jgi:hypothetical protein
MAYDLVEVHGRCGRRFAALVAGVGPERWHDDTPCSDWDVRALVPPATSQAMVLCAAVGASRRLPAGPARRAEIYDDISGPEWTAIDARRASRVSWS